MSLQICNKHIGIATCQSVIRLMQKLTPHSLKEVVINDCDISE